MNITEHGAGANTGTATNITNVISFVEPRRLKSTASATLDHTLTYKSLRRLFDDNRDFIPVRHWLEIDRLQRRLRSGERSTPDDNRFVHELRVGIRRARGMGAI